MEKKIAFLSGNEALAQGAWEAGLQFTSAYPGTPSTEILETLAKYNEVDAQWASNEKVAYEVAFGAAVAGARTMYTSKHVGLNVAMDPLMSSVYMGVNGAFVAVVADDPGVHSSQNEQDSRRIGKHSKMPILEPSGSNECQAMIKDAFKLSEDFDTPVLFRLTTRVSHSKENIDLGDRVEVPVKEYKNNIPKNVLVPGVAKLKRIALEDKIEKLKEFSNNSHLNRIEMGADTSIGYICNGISYVYLKDKFPNASIMKVGMSFPFPAEIAKKFASKVDKVFVVEELEPIMAEECILAGIKIEQKHSTYNYGEFRPEDIKNIIAGGKRQPETAAPERKPQLCKGCPHTNSFNIIKELDLTVVGDIGCYTLGAMLGSLHTCLCMGASVPFMEGFGKTLGKNVIGVIGDSTFCHTGINGLISAAYNNAKGVLIIMDNSTTAMTGTQDNPATGVTLKGQATKQLNLEAICKAAGADNVDVINPIKKIELKALLQKRLAEDALSVVIARAPCLLELRKQAKLKKKKML